jgi:hypothetical protein
MTLSAAGLVADAVAEAGFDDFGGDTFHEGLARLTESLAAEGELTELGEEILGMRLRMLLVNRLRIEDTYRAHPAIDDERVEGPVVIIGLPRTGTTALSHLLSTDPQIRSVRTWESSAPVPPPEAATQDTDARIEETGRGLEAMYEAFPRMKSMHFQTATGATECQDLLGMEFRTAHFGGMAHVPAYSRWVEDCDMAPAYRYHRRTLRLLQWHCPPRLWHLKTPVHMLALDQLADVYPEARFVWTHRDPVAVLASVCSLIAYTRSWVSDRVDGAELGAEQVELWAEALARAMAYRTKVGEARFADVVFDRLNADPVATVEAAYGAIGLTLGDEGARRMQAWADRHPRGEHGSHEYTLEEFGLDARRVGDRYRFYTEAFALPVAHG